MPLVKHGMHPHGRRPLNKVLVANRGEIACRIIRALDEMGIPSVAVYSDADEGALHASMAHEAHRLGPAPPRDSYLNITRILEVARMARVDAIHPGYGFLSENPAFARAAQEAGFTFIGPPAPVIEALGNKVRARELARQAGVETVPGSPGPVTSAREAAQAADRIGYPVLLKAASGGGGKGMRTVWSEGELADAYQRAGAEAQAAFGDSSVYVEKCLMRPHHVEVQILADSYGLVVHLHERECSVQRRHQKVIEETPSPTIDGETRLRLCLAAVRLARKAGYIGAGTVEFLVDTSGSFYFLEVNTRLQVEHPITEWVTGLDLVKLQVRIAAGEPLVMGQQDIHVQGAAIECRIYAEDPDRGFMPSPGRIQLYRHPGGPWVREDTGYGEGAVVPDAYDALLSKVSAWGSDRHQALRRMRAALADMAILGVRTTLPFHVRALATPAFERGDVATDFIERHAEALARPASARLEEIAAIAGAVSRYQRGVATNSSPARPAEESGDGRGERPSAWSAYGRLRPPMGFGLP